MQIGASSFVRHLDRHFKSGRNKTITQSVHRPMLNRSLRPEHFSIAIVYNSILIDTQKRFDTLSLGKGRLTPSDSIDIDSLCFQTSHFNMHSMHNDDLCISTRTTLARPHNSMKRALLLFD
jgi:hypothetical protein